jgi:PAS domain-containing protein
VDREECPVRIHLADEYSQAVTAFSVLLESLKIAPPAGKTDLNGIEVTRLRAEHAWNCLEAHLVAHQCLELHWSARAVIGSPPSRDLLQAAAMAALDVILVADDERRLVDLNDAAAAALNMPRSEVVGRKVEEFFSEIRGQTVPDAWNDFIADGVQCGICELVAAGGARRFEYRAKANFAPGLHLGVLRHVSGEAGK